MADKSRLHASLYEAPSPPSPTERWLAMDLEISRLASQWAALETEMARNFGWFDLSDAERHALPQASLLFAIEGKLDRLSIELEQNLALLTQLQTTDFKGAIAKLAVAVRILEQEDSPTRKLVADAMDAIATHRCPDLKTL